MKPYRNIRFFNHHVSFLLNQKSFVLFIAVFFGALLLIVTSAALGEIKISPLNVVSVFLGGGSEMDRLVIQTFRLPRILIALLAGMGLAAAGAILQGVIRNPLASPDILGISGGASVAVVGFLAYFSDKNNALTVSIHWLPLAAFFGALLAAFCLYLFAWKNGVTPLRLVLVGIGLMSLAKALTTLMMILAPIYQASQANIWITGTVYGSNWANVRSMLPWIGILMIVAWLLTWKMNLQELGEDVATGLGQNVQKQRFIFMMISTGLIGCSVAFAGAVGFVGLMAPHIARRLVGASFGLLLPVSALLGGILVMLADLIGRTLFSPLEVPAGVFTAAIGAPYFFYLLFKTRNHE